MMLDIASLMNSATLKYHSKMECQGVSSSEPAIILASVSVWSCSCQSSNRKEIKEKRLEDEVL